MEPLFVVGVVLAGLYFAGSKKTAATAAPKPAIAHSITVGKVTTTASVSKGTTPPLRTATAPGMGGVTIQARKPIPVNKPSPVSGVRASGVGTIKPTNSTVEPRTLTPSSYPRVVPRIFSPNVVSGKGEFLNARNQNV